MAMSTRVTELQQAALWKWRWLGFKDSTPAFKASILLLEVAAFALAIVAIVSN